MVKGAKSETNWPPMGPDFVRGKPDEDWATTEANRERFLTTVPMGRMVKPQEIAYASFRLSIVHYWYFPTSRWWRYRNGIKVNIW